ncbi:unnamed protein product [Sympodiomycopsis kandeliae]
MNSLSGYASDSGSENGEPSTSSNTIQASGPTSNSKTATADGASEDEEDIPADPNDAFGLNGISTSRNGNAIASETQESNSAATRPPTDPGAIRHLKRPRSDDNQSEHQSSSSSSSALIKSAPDVPPDHSLAQQALLIRPTDTEMHVNIPYSEMSRPIVGPSNPFSTRRLGAQQNSLSGHYEATAMNDYDFRNQQRTFDTQGYARNPGQFGGEFIGDQSRALQLNGASSNDLRAGGTSESRKASKALRKTRMGNSGDASVTEGQGAYVGPWGGWEGEAVNVDEGVGPSEEEIQRAEDLSTNRKKEKQAAEERRAREEEQGTEKSVFHGKSMYDYQGRTYMHIPGDVDVDLYGEAGSQTCFIPKTCIHTWTGHTKGVSAVRSFPGSGHLLLSGSMDTKIKLWDVYKEGNCLRTFMGHSKAVRDVQFSNDGRRFLSAGYDRQMKLWDTETGQCLKAFSNGKVPYCIKFHPDEDKQNIFLAGMSDKKIIQYDINTGEITQEYNQHLGAVNTLTFVDENRRFVTTSDDKTMRAWDFDIPVVIKYVADPLMHSMPAVTPHPNKKWLATQSLDDNILVYSSDTLKQNYKKSFKGHSIAGYACEIGFSPDGRFISSGDGQGNLIFWDWKSSKILKRINKAHKEVIISHTWLPHSTSGVVTGSWDGTIKLWD